MNLNMKKILVFLLSAVLLLFSACSTGDNNTGTGEDFADVSTKVKYKESAQNTVKSLAGDGQEIEFNVTAKSIHEENNYEKYSYTGTVEVKSSNAQSSKAEETPSNSSGVEAISSAITTSNKETVIKGDVLLNHTTGDFISISIGGSTGEIETIYTAIENILAAEPFKLAEAEIKSTLTKIKSAPEDKTLSQDLTKGSFTYVFGDGICLFTLSV